MGIERPHRIGLLPRVIGGATLLASSIFNPGLTQAQRMLEVVIDCSTDHTIAMNFRDDIPDLYLRVVSYNGRNEIGVVVAQPSVSLPDLLAALSDHQEENETRLDQFTDHPSQHHLQLSNPVSSEGLRQAVGLCSGIKIT